MPRRSGVDRSPNEYVSSGEWPDGRIDGDAPSAVLYARVISRRLRDAIEDRAVSHVAERADLARSTLYDILNGETWIDVVSMAKLEQVLGERLWPLLDEVTRDD